ncbi:MAG: M28 family peptidase [Candidatus Omnitrophota bacterium]
MLKSIARLFFVGSITFLIVKLSTFGWTFDFSSKAKTKPDAEALAGRLKDHVYTLSHEIGERDVFGYYANLERSEDYIADVFKKHGYDVSFQEYVVADRKVRNIIAVKKGTQRPGEIVLIGAHYDTCANPGANDNASGIAGLLELAGLISEQPAKRTIEFIAFVNEEPPFFQTRNMGSRVYAKAARERGDDIRAVVILECLGIYSERLFSQRYPALVGFFYPNKADYIAVVGNFKSRLLVGEVASGLRTISDLPVVTLALNLSPAIAFSDHWSFWQEGYAAVMVTDTAFFRSRTYHQPSDTYEKLNYQKMASVVKGLETFVLKEANQEAS